MPQQTKLKDTLKQRPYDLRRGHSDVRTPPAEAAYRANTQETETANKDCEAKEAKQFAEEEELLVKADKALKQFSAIIKTICKNRVHVGDMGTSCQNTPPDFDNLQKEHRLCEETKKLLGQIGDTRPVPGCQNLIPLSAAKKYPKEPATAK